MDGNKKKMTSEEEEDDVRWNGRVNRERKEVGEPDREKTRSVGWLTRDRNILIGLLVFLLAISADARSADATQVRCSHVSRNQDEIKACCTPVPMEALN